MQMPTKEQLDLQTRYDNARIATNMGWNIAGRMNAGTGVSLEKLAEIAKAMATYIAKDLDNTMKILEEKSAETETSTAGVH